MRQLTQQNGRSPSQPLRSKQCFASFPLNFFIGRFLFENLTVSNLQRLLMVWLKLQFRSRELLAHLIQTR